MRPAGGAASRMHRHGWPRWSPWSRAECAGSHASGFDRGDTCGAELQVLNVDPDAWGGGVGGALLSAAEAALAADGFTAAVLWVLRDNPRARSVYERRGWTYDNAEQDLDFNGTAVREVRYARSL